MRYFLKSFGYALAGIKLSFKQRNMKIHAVCAVIVILCGCLWHISTTDWCILLLCIGLVMALEVLNTAIEHLVDLVSPDYHPLAGKVKDLAAGAVLVMSITAAMIGIVILGKYILVLFSI